MDCHDAKERILEGREGAAVRRHVERCEDCGAYARELAGGGRRIARAFLAVPPSPGFEDRVAARVREREISIRDRARTRPVRVLVAALVPAVLAGVYLLLTAPSEAPPVPSEPETIPVIVVTEPFRENPLVAILSRDELTGPTQLALDFAGEARALTLPGDLEGELLRAWALGARRVEMTVAPEVPGREIVAAIEAMEKAGFGFELVRLKAGT